MKNIKIIYFTGYVILIILAKYLSTRYKLMLAGRQDFAFLDKRKRMLILYFKKLKYKINILQT